MEKRRHGDTWGQEIRGSLKIRGQGDWGKRRKGVTVYRRKSKYLKSKMPKYLNEPDHRRDGLNAFDESDFQKRSCLIYPASYYNSTNRIAGFIRLLNELSDYNDFYE